VPGGCVPIVAAFYQQAFNASVVVRDLNGARHAVVTVGPRQQLIYAESDAAAPNTMVTISKSTSQTSPGLMLGWPSATLRTAKNPTNTGLPILLIPPLERAALS
jgi:hypothetical protein